MTRALAANRPPAGTRGQTPGAGRAARRGAGMARRAVAAALLAATFAAPALAGDHRRAVLGGPFMHGDASLTIEVRGHDRRGERPPRDRAGDQRARADRGRADRGRAVEDRAERVPSHATDAWERARAEREFNRRRTGQRDGERQAANRSGFDDRIFDDRRATPLYGDCRPRRALRKAWRMGVDEPRIHRVGRRAVVVSGYRGREYVRVRFSRERRCPVLAVRAF